jgi:hypothetical protein
MASKFSSFCSEKNVFVLFSLAGTGQPEEARKQINECVAATTNNLIKSILGSRRLLLTLEEKI